MATQFLKCSACGFIIKKPQLGEVCPACGAKRAAFKEFEPKISEKRRKLLDLHIHPIMTHFSNGLSTLIFLLVLGTLVLPNFYRIRILDTIFILSLLLPPFVILTMLAGMLDGKTRFKQVTTPHLVKKLIFGSIFVALSFILALVALLSGISEAELWIVLFLSLSCILCGGFLAKIGGSLLCSKLPG